MCEQSKTFRSTQLPRIERIVPDFHGDGVKKKKKNGGPTFFKFVACVQSRINMNGYNIVASYVKTTFA